MQLSQDILNRLTNRDLSVVKYIVIHHTADTDMNKDIEEIASEEEASQGFTTVGYHAVIHGNGTVQFGRPIGKVPAANIGMNTVSYAISLKGNFQSDDSGYTGEKPTPEQIHAAIQLIDMVKAKLPNLKYLIGHRDVSRIMNDPSSATACPGDILYNQLPGLRKAVGLESK